MEDNKCQQSKSQKIKTDFTVKNPKKEKKLTLENNINLTKCFI